MKVEIPYHYTEQVVPKRCRKPRRQSFTATIKLRVREVTGEQAPVAIREHYTDIYSDHDESGQRPRSVREYRWYGGSLWELDSFQRGCGTPYETQTAEQFSRDPWPFAAGKGADWIGWRARGMSHRTRRDCQTEFRQWARSLLFIDGVRYRAAGEPRYVVMTYGLGHNHGIGWGTSLSVSNSYNSNISRDRYFRADQFEQAVAAATGIAARRSDTKALPIVEAQNPNRFEVLIPEAVRLQPAREHGAGDPFINSLEAIAAGAPSANVAGLLAMVAAIVPKGVA